MINLTVNGKAHSLDVDPEIPLLWVLRDVLNLTGTSYSCGMALCGSCKGHVTALQLALALRQFSGCRENRSRRLSRLARLST